MASAHAEPAQSALLDRSGTSRSMGRRGQAAGPVGPLTVEAVDGDVERSAQRAAADVIRRLAGTAAAADQSPRDPAFAAGGRVDAGTEAGIRQAMHAGGEELASGVRGRLESAIGTDLGHVRVHRDTNSGDLATGVAARAFTVGSHVFLGAAAQRSYDTRGGDALMAHEVAHTLQDGGGLQRVALSTDEVVEAVTKISFIKKKLAEHVRFDDDAATRRSSVAPIRDHVAAVLGQYKANLAGADGVRDEAMALSIVMDAVSKVLAFNVLNDPDLAPRLASEMIGIYGADLRKRLSKSDNVDETLALTRVIVSDDPLRLYLHNELRIDYAARRIRTMAFAAGLEPEKMFDLLRGRFEVDMAARTRAGIAAEEDKKEAYNVRSSTGEMSEEWFVSLFGDVAAPTWQGQSGDRSLTYTQGTQQKLDDLLVEVRTARKVAAPTARAGLTWKQSQHLDEVDASDTQRNTAVQGMPTVEDRVAAAIQRELGVSSQQAATITGVVRAGLANLPLTVTVQGDGWFGSLKKRKDPTADKEVGDFDYAAGSSRRQATTYRNLFGRTSKGADGKDRSIAHYGKWTQGENDTQDRTGNYNRFRGWKDQVMTGRRGFASEELPGFAALNPNWKAFGADTGTDRGGKIGVNSYGNVHFVLDPARVRGRLVYTATDHGEPHTDPFLAFADFLLAGKAESRTGLKDITSMKKVALHVINSVVRGDQAAVTALANQAFEVQIFGTLNMINDSLSLHYADSASPTAKANMQEFGRRFHRTVNAIPPNGLNVEGESVYAAKKQFGAAVAQAIV